MARMFSQPSKSANKSKKAKKAAASRQHFSLINSLSLITTILMKDIKDELQHIILGDGPPGKTDNLKKVQVFLRGHEETSVTTEKKQHFKDKEAAELLKFAETESLFYNMKLMRLIL